MYQVYRGNGSGTNIFQVDTSVAGNLPELQLHVKLATTSSNLLESQSEDERKTALHLTAQHGSLVFWRAGIAILLMVQKPFTAWNV